MIDVPSTVKKAVTATIAFLAILRLNIRFPPQLEKNCRTGPRIAKPGSIAAVFGLPCPRGEFAVGRVGGGDFFIFFVLFIMFEFCTGGRGGERAGLCGRAGCEGGNSSTP